MPNLGGTHPLLFLLKFPTSPFCLLYGEEDDFLFCCCLFLILHSHSPTTHWADSFEQPTDPSEVAPVKGETKNISCVAGVQPRLIQGIRRGDGVGDLI